MIFDLDGTLIDSDTALVETFLRLGVPRHEISFGHAIEVECARLGLTVDDYIEAYDDEATQPYPGVSDMLAGVGEWSICSNKARASAHAELVRFRWRPRAAMFADDFGGRPKELGPLLDLLGVEPATVVFIGDTDHDEHCARHAGTDFRWAGWNPRVPAGPDVLAQPSDVLSLLG